MSQSQYKIGAIFNQCPADTEAIKNNNKIKDVQKPNLDPFHSRVPKSLPPFSESGKLLFWWVKEGSGGGNNLGEMRKGMGVSA